MARPIFTHPGQPLLPHDLWTGWTLEPTLLIPLGLTVLLYAWGTWRLWRRAGLWHGITRRNLLAFAGAILALGVALVSPLDALSESLFSAHMFQHLVLILIAAPLLVLCNLPLAFLWALPHGYAHKVGRSINQSRPLIRAWRILSSPVSAWLLFTLAMWVWHAPYFYEAALREDTLHIVEHLCYLATAMLFWWVLFSPAGAAHLRYGAAVPYLFSTSVQSGILGALMTFTTQPWYSFYADRVGPWGFTPLQDQQLAGLIMWLPGGLVFTLLTIGYFAAWLHAIEQRSPQADPLRPGQERK